jgi:flagellar protein FliO/FliZ
VSAATLLVPMLALAGVVGLILLARRGAMLLPSLARLQSAPGPLRLEQVLALDARRRLLLVRCGPRRVLLLTGPGHDTVVGWLADADAAEPPP